MLLIKFKEKLGNLLFNISIESELYRYIKLNRSGFTLISRFLEKRFSLKYACYISRNVTLGERISFRHPVGVVIGEGVYIGNDVIIFQNVTLGAAKKGDGAKGLYPKIGDRCTIFAGAVIVGDVTIGEDCVIGANVVVSENIPNNTIVTKRTK